MKRKFSKFILLTIAVLGLFVTFEEKAHAQSEPFVGQLAYVAFNYAPRGWAQCNGKIIPIAENQMLFALIGNLYGGDGRTTFALPDMRGRVPIHQGSGYTMGKRGGAEKVTPTLQTLASHTHDLTGNLTGGLTGNAILKAGSGNADNADPNGRSLAITIGGGKTSPMAYNSSAPTVNMKPGSIDLSGVSLTIAGGTIGATGGGQAHNNMQPYTVLNCIIALDGLYPPRS